MRYSFFVHYLILGICFTSQIWASLLFDDIFQIYEEPQLGYCSSGKAVKMVLHVLNMQSAASLLHSNIPANREQLQARTLDVVNLFFIIEGSADPYNSFRATTGLTSDFIDPSTRGDEIAGPDHPREGAPHEPKDSRHLVLCDSTPIVLKLYNDQLPFQHGSYRTVGELYKSGDKYWYFWIDSIGGMARVPKSELPPIPAGKNGAGLPFPEYEAGTGASFCANEDNRAWSLIVDKWSSVAPREKAVRRAVFVLCPRYFTATKPRSPAELLPAKIDLAPQVRNTPLEVMEPAWLTWYMEVIAAARSMDRMNGRPISWVEARQVKPGGDRTKKQGWEELAGQKALTASQCIELGEWQLAFPKRRSRTIKNFPSLWNAPSFAWLTVAVWLQEKGEEPQSWATGSAGKFFDEEDDGGGDDGGGDDGGGNGGGGNDGGGNDGRDGGHGGGGGHGGPREAPRPFLPNPLPHLGEGNVDCDEADGGRGDRMEL